MSSASPCGCSFPARRWDCTRRCGALSTTCRPQAGADQPPVVDYLKAQVSDGGEALLRSAGRARTRAGSAPGAARPVPCRPRICICACAAGATRSSSMKRRWPIDPDNAAAHLGLCRMALRRRNFSVAAQSALDALQRIHHRSAGPFPAWPRVVGNGRVRARGRGVSRRHFLQSEFSGSARSARQACSKSISGDAESAREHRRLARSMSEGRTLAADAPGVCRPSRAWFAPSTACARRDAATFQESLIVVTGLPRSGTSLLMQMLAAGGIDVLSDATAGGR